MQTTVNLPIDIHKRLNTKSQSARDSISGDRDKAEFWRQISAIDPREYNAAILSDGDFPSEDYQIEDSLISADEKLL